MDSTSSILSCLPEEVLDDIAHNASPADQASLSRTSRLLNEVATRCLYRNITAHTPHQIVRCCETLVRNVSASAAVRALHIKCWQTSKTLPAYYMLISRALKQTRHLQTFTLSHTLDRQKSLLLLVDVFLPNLRDLTITATKTSYIAKFLHQHPKIDRLAVFGEMAHDCDLLMPALYSFTGHHSLIRVLAHSSPNFTDLHIYWYGATNEDYEYSLRPLACSPVKYVSCSEFAWSSQFFDALTRHIPHLDTIRLTWDTAPTESQLKLIDMALPALNSLYSLDIRPSRLAANVDPAIVQGFETVTAWGNACASLGRVHFHAQILPGYAQTAAHHSFARALLGRTASSCLWACSSRGNTQIQWQI
ncbi:hypothetical protein FIBSPDRAFT_544396 [Athelia psychrophila]|uniref:F-box domain-containing protein n=1 Tax=Athelia psychrophila TaxID=1759441 RepID=A0A166IUF1_9AGAM|nr:hypothetical protein FIBSPDRAFT_544396 [Fibularhizoctonia sp. CBS 109695]